MRVSSAGLVCCLLLMLFFLAPLDAQQPAKAVEAEEFVEVKGLLIPYEQARIASRAKGVIESIAREGQLVGKGDTLLLLESDMEQLQLEQQQRVLELRTFEWEASTELNEKSVISQVEVQEKRVNFEIAKVQLAQAERLLERRKVLAPFAGAIAERLRETGEAVDEFVPVLLLVNQDRLYLEVFLPAVFFADKTVGAPVSVKVSQGGEEMLREGKIAQIFPTVNPASGEFKVRILIDNADRKLVSGTYATALFPKIPGGATEPGAGVSGIPEQQGR